MPEPLAQELLCNSWKATKLRREGGVKSNILVKEIFFDPLAHLDRAVAS